MLKFNLTVMHVFICHLQYVYMFIYIYIYIIYIYIYIYIYSGGTFYWTIYMMLVMITIPYMMTNALTMFLCLHLLIVQMSVC